MHYWICMIWFSKVWTGTRYKANRAFGCSQRPYLGIQRLQTAAVAARNKIKVELCNLEPLSANCTSCWHLIDIPPTTALCNTSLVGLLVQILTYSHIVGFVPNIFQIYFQMHLLSDEWRASKHLFTDQRVK